MISVLLICVFFQTAQFFKMAQSACDCHCIHLFQKSGKTLCIPEQIPVAGQFTSYVVVWYTDIVPIAVFPCDYVEVSPTARDLCFVTGSRMSDKPDLPVPSFFSFPSCKSTLIFHSTSSYIRFWLLTAARITSASIDFFSICEPRARASVIRLSIRRGFPWEWLWMAERAAFSIMVSLPPAQVSLWRTYRATSSSDRPEKL